MKVLNKHAPQKETFAKGNHQMSFMMKDFPKKWWKDQDCEKDFRKIGVK